METLTMEQLHNKTIFQFCKYCIAIGVGTAIDLGLFTLILSVTSLNYILVNAFSMSLGTIVNYYLLKNWTFKNTSDRHIIIFGKFIFSVAIYFLFANIILIICISVLNLNPFLSKIIQICITFVWGYHFNKWFVFR